MTLSSDQLTQWRALCALQRVRTALREALDEIDRLRGVLHSERTVIPDDSRREVERLLAQAHPKLSLYLKWDGSIVEAGQGDEPRESDVELFERAPGVIRALLDEGQTLRVDIATAIRDRDAAQRRVKQAQGCLAHIATIITCSGAPSRTGVTASIAIDKIIKVLQDANALAARKEGT